MKKKPITFSEADVVKIMEAAAAVCKIYFEIGEEVLGTEELRKRFNKRLNKEVKKRKKN